MHRAPTLSSRAVRRAAQRASAKSLQQQTRNAHKEIKFSNDGRAAILKGVDVLANAVSVTLGPKGASCFPFCSMFLFLFPVPESRVPVSLSSGELGRGARSGEGRWMNGALTLDT